MARLRHVGAEQPVELPELVIESIKASAVTATGTDDVAPASPAVFDFAEFTRPMTILGKLAGLRRVLARVRPIAATAW